MITKNKIGAFFDFDETLLQLASGRLGIQWLWDRGLVCVDQNKKRLSLKLAESIGFDLGKSYAYGNHQSDLPLLELVGNPHVVEPSTTLEKIAHQRSWPILTYK